MPVRVEEHWEQATILEVGEEVATAGKTVARSAGEATLAFAAAAKAVVAVVQKGRLVGEQLGRFAAVSLRVDSVAEQMEAVAAEVD